MSGTDAARGVAVIVMRDAREDLLYPVVVRDYENFRKRLAALRGGVMTKVEYIWIPGT